MNASVSPVRALEPQAGPPQTPPVRFQGAAAALMAPVNQAVGLVAENVYGRGEGFRYLFEQTVGYTVPRTVQQLNRTRAITGEDNVMAAREMLVRDLAADFTDTILPGLLAASVIGPAIDRMHHTFVRHSMGSQALAFYEGVAREAVQRPDSRQAFHQLLGERLQAFAQGKTGQAIPVDLAQEIHQLRQAQPTSPLLKAWRKVFRVTAPPQQAVVKAAQDLAGRLGLSELDLELSHGIDAAHKKTLSVTLPDLLRDLSHINHPNPRVTGKAPWAAEVAHLLQKTRSLSKYQMVGNVAALAASISIPFAVRLMTRRLYGADAFPGTKALKDHFGETASTPPDSPDAVATEKKFVLFPFLQKSLKEGNWLPTALTLGFFGVLGGTVVRRFAKDGANLLKPKDWLRVYEFKRHFPFTTVTQMELTYGLLCGFRLASSRDDMEFRETGIRDCLMGWPTLTYFYEGFNKFIGNRVLNKALGKQFGNANLLMKANGEVREAEEIHAKLLGNLGLKHPVEQVQKAITLNQNWMKVVSGAVSWFALALAEPQLGIWLTNHTALKRLKANQGSLPPVAPTLSTPSGQGVFTHPLPPPALMGAAFGTSEPRNPFAAFRAQRPLSPQA